MFETLLYAALGENPDAEAYPTAPNELGKIFVSKMAAGAPYLFLDNLAGKVESATLAIALTQTRYTGRLLGTNTSLAGAIKWVWAATGNNPELSPELTRRAVAITIDAGMAPPDTRTGFKHNLEQCREEHRD